MDVRKRSLVCVVLSLGLVSSGAEASGGGGAAAAALFMFALVFGLCMLVAGSVLVEKIWRGLYWRTMPLILLVGFGVSLVAVSLVGDVLGAVVLLILLFSPPCYALGLSFKRR